MLKGPISNLNGPNLFNLKVLDFCIFLDITAVDLRVEILFGEVVPFLVIINILPMIF